MPFAKCLGAAALCFALAGCNDYFDNDDHMTPWSGEANAANRSIQMVDPWAPHASRNNFGMYGPRAERAIERYRTGATPSTTAPAGAEGAAAAGASENSAKE